MLDKEGGNLPDTKEARESAKVLELLLMLMRWD
uniref:Uncharacterized protein n=1 Tax=Utricularia reniformis TaxID=192314 RepID=A0A1Y0B3K8_9LAMI|nr:hypothetical protein AEK19_MT1742 [Utricularia reniformis]ART31919.1 hypothetical protein AEK19_MT1742 [Utricularia reniformis]